jgi:hypothetical protein
MFTSKAASSIFIFDHDETHLDNYEDFVGFSIDNNFEIIINVSEIKDHEGNNL